MTLPLNGIVDVVVQVSPASAARAGFNLGLIIGKSTKITPTIRVKTYASLTEMQSDGWAGTEPEYKAAVIYFSQSPKPSKVAIGRWDGTGSETAAQAVSACRATNTDWYACYICDAAKADIIAVAPIIEAATPVSTFFYTTKDAEVKANTAGNVCETLKGAKYTRTIGLYSTVDYAGAGVMGYAMGANTGLDNSAYTLCYKIIVGVNPETLTSAEVTIIKNLNCNVYVNRGYTYNSFEQGIVAAGTPYDEIINIDVLTNEIQLGIMDLLAGVPKIPQTDEGTALLVNAVSGACIKAKRKGFIAPGVWNAGSIKSLNTGDMLSNGYLVLADTIAEQTQADRDARKAPNIYVPIKLAGAIEHVIVSVTVNR